MPISKDRLFALSRSFVADKIAEGARISETYIKFKPHYKQEIFLNLDEDPTFTNQEIIECLYGGAAGGAKTVALLMAALKYVHIKDYSALLLRKNYPDLVQEGGLMSLAFKWLSDTDAKWNGDYKTWTFPSGATLRFGHLSSEIDKYNYQGGEYQFVGFDELTQFTESQYLYLFSRVRRKKNLNVPLRIYSASNPGGSGGKWVYERFIPEDFTPDKVKDQNIFLKTQGNFTRIFIPAVLDDNPYIDKESYYMALSQLDDVTRMQYLRGDWNIQARGDILYTYSDLHCVISWSQFKRVFGLSENKIPSHWKVGVFQDFGTNKDHPCVTSWFATAAENSPTVNGVDLKGTVYLYRGLMIYPAIASEVGKKIKQIMGPEIGQASIWQMSHEAAAAREEYRKYHNLPFSSWKAGRTNGIEQLKDAFMLRDKDKPHPFKSGLYGHPKLFLIVDDNELVTPKTDAGLARWREEIVAYHWNIPKSGNPSMKLIPYALFNDAVDTMRYAAAVYFPTVTPKTIEELVKEKVDKEFPVNKLIAVQDDNYKSHLFTMRNIFQEKVKEELEENNKICPDWMNIG